MLFLSASTLEYEWWTVSYCYIYPCVGLYEMSCKMLERNRAILCKNCIFSRLSFFRAVLGSQQNWKKVQGFPIYALYQHMQKYWIKKLSRLQDIRLIYGSQLLSSNEQIKFKIQNTISFILATPQTKYLCINLTKYLQDKYEANYKTLMEKIKIIKDMERNSTFMDRKNQHCQDIRSSCIDL